jgi:histidine ammonia-lyase
MKTVSIDGENLTLEQVEDVALGKTLVRIDPTAISKINKCRKYVEKILEKHLR